MITTDVLVMVAAEAALGPTAEEAAVPQNVGGGASMITTGVLVPVPAEAALCPTAEEAAVPPDVKAGPA